MTTVWVPSPNKWTGRPRGAPIAIVIHTMDGTLAGCDSWFANPASQVSAHYGVGLDGAIHSYVRTGDRAWANGIVEPGSVWLQLAEGNPNDLTVSIETEDLGDASCEVPDPQYLAVRTLVRTVRARYGQMVLLGHDQISPRSRPNCPGSRWRDSGRLDQLAQETGTPTVDPQ